MSTGLKLWQFADDLTALYDTLEGADDPAIKLELEKRIDETLSNVAAKVDGCYEFLSRSDAEADRLGNEIKNLQARKKAIENRATSIEGRLVEFMNFTEQKALEGEVHNFKLVQNPEALNITDQREIPARFMTIIPAQYIVNNAELKKALQSGLVVPGAELTRGERLKRS